MNRQRLTLIPVHFPGSGQYSLDLQTASTEPRSRERGEGAMDWRDYRDIKDFASTEPRSRERGESPRFTASAGVIGKASTEPRSRERGEDENAAGDVTDLLNASTEPRSRERGECGCRRALTRIGSRFNGAALT